MSPLEIPGIPLGLLPDDKSSGKCPNCGQSYRSVKILKIGDRAIKFCPHCGKRITKKKKK